MDFGRDVCIVVVWCVIYYVWDFFGCYDVYDWWYGKIYGLC